MDTLSIPSFDEVSRLGCFDTFIGVGGVELTVVGRRNVTEGGPRTGTAYCEEVIASTDGRMVHVDTMQGDEHERAEDGDVYFEVWRVDGSGMHGWADAASRQIVQVG